jgi:hypothetical protein
MLLPTTVGVHCQPPLVGYHCRHITYFHFPALSRGHMTEMFFEFARVCDLLRELSYGILDFKPNLRHLWVFLWWLCSEMANRANKPNRTFSRSCSVCSSSAPHRTEPNSVLVRFVFGRFSNIDILVRFCSNRTRTEQYLCSVRVLQVRTISSKVEDHMKDGCYLTGKWIQ